MQYISRHTIDSKSIRKQSLTLRPSWFPPKSTAWWLLTAVKEKSLQGGGLGPVVGGEDHLPASSKIDCLMSENQYSIERFHHMITIPYTRINCHASWSTTCTVSY